MGTKTTFLGEITVRTNKYILPRNFYSSRKVKNVWRAVPFGYFFFTFCYQDIAITEKKNLLKSSVLRQTPPRIF